MLQLSSQILKLRLATRNVMRNRRRTALNVLVIGASVAAIVIFKGFAHYMIERLREVTINSQFGHMQIASEKTWRLSAKDSPKGRFILPDQQYLEKIKAMPEVDYVSGRISFFGLVSAGDQSLSARGFAFDPVVEKQMSSTMKIVDGRALSPESKFEVIIGSGLQGQLASKIGNSVTLLGYTVEGSVNAIDAEVVGIFQTGLEEIDNLSFFVGLATAKRLLDTDSVERYVVLLKETKDVDRVAASIGEASPSGIGVRAWHELASTFKQVSTFFLAQNVIVQWILMALALLATANTVGMSISERAGEIGTVRALGNTRGEIITQFLIEGIILGLLGGVVGCALGYGMSEFIGSLKIPIYPPGISVAVLVKIHFLPGAYRDAILMTCAMTILATLIPAYHASRLKVVDAIKRNI